MHKLVRELKQVMKETEVSRERASHFLHVSPMTIYRWLKDDRCPNMSSRRIIQEGIEKIKTTYPKIKKTNHDLSIKARDLYRKIKFPMTLEAITEKAELLDIAQDKGPEEYIEALEKLVKKYGNKVRKIKSERDVKGSLRFRQAEILKITEKTD